MLFLAIIALPTLLTRTYSLEVSCSSNSIVELKYQASEEIIFLPPSSDYSIVTFQSLPLNGALLLSDLSSTVTLSTEYSSFQNFHFKSDNTESTGLFEYSFSSLTDTTSCSLSLKVIPCYVSCSACEEKGDNINNKCLSCFEGYYPIEDQDFQCTNSDPSTIDKQYFFDLLSQMYLLCAPDKKDTYYKCLSCQNSNTYFYNNKCISVKPTNTYISDQDYNKLDDCYNSCSECFVGGNITHHSCSICKEGYMTDTVNQQNCYMKCDSGYGIDKIKNICINCRNNNSYSFPSENICVSNLIKGYYLDTQSNSLLPCHENCELCSQKGDDTNNKCDKCLYNNTFNSNGHCVMEKCPEYLFTDLTNNKCFNCKVDGKYLYNGKCFQYDELPINVYVEDDNYNYAKECYETCSTCSMKGDKNHNNCDSCKDSYFFTVDNNCVDKCPQYTVKDDVLKQCIFCKEMGLFYNEEQCVSSCPDGSEGNEINNICVPTLNNCLITCFNGGICEDGKCKCPSEFKGEFCEFSQINQNDLEIVQINDLAVRINQINSFSFKFLNDKNINDEDSIIEWKINISKNDTLTGLNEKTLKLKPYSLQKTNLIEVSVTINDITYKSSLEISISLIDINIFSIDITYQGNFIIPYRTVITLTITQEETKEIGYYKYKYKYKNEFGDIVPISTYDFDYIGIYRGMIPETNTIYIEISDPLNQIIQKCLDLTNYISTNNDELIVYDIYNEYLSIKDQNQVYITNYISQLVKKKETLLVDEEYEVIKNIINKEKNIETIPLNFQLIKSVAGNKRLYSKEKVEEYGNKMIDLYKSAISKISFQSLKDEEVYSITSTIDVFIQNSFSNSKPLIKEVNKELSQSIDLGELIQINTQTFSSTLFKLDNQNKLISIKPNSDNASIQHSNSETLSQTCDIGNDAFCIDNSTYSKLKNELKYLSKNIEDITFSIVTLNTSTLPSITYSKGNRLLSDSSNDNDALIPLSTLSISTYLFNKNTSIVNSPLSYNYTLSLPNDNLDYPLNKDSSSDKACVTVSSIKSASTYCSTYFNYQTNRTICKCKGNAEITLVLSKTLSNYYKLLQFPSISISQLNPFTLTFIITSFMILISLTIASLYVDFKDDTNILRKPNTYSSSKKYLSQIFRDHLNLASTSLITFAFYTTSYIYPFFGIFHIYHIDSPRYVRFFIEIFSTILSIVFSIMPYYYSPFTYKELFINERDIEKIGWNIHNLPSKIIDIIYSFFYSFISSMIMLVLINLFAFFVKYKILLIEIWNHKKKCIKMYTKKYIMIDYIKSTGKWKKIKMRLFSYYNFVKIYKEINMKKFEFLDIKENEMEHNALISRSNDITPTNRNDVSYNTLNTTIYSKRKLLYYETNNNEYIVIQSKVNDFQLTKNNHYKLKKTKKNKNDKESLTSLKPPFIRSNKLSYKEGDNDEIIIIDHQLNYSVFNYSMNKSDKINNKKQLCIKLKTLLTSICIIGFLGIVYYYTIAIFSNVYEKYENYIIKIWLFPVIYDILIGRLISNCVYGFIKILFIKFFYHTRKNNWILRKIFQFLIPSYLVNMIKIRNIMMKYHKYIV